ncbi:MAG: hypothetical protein SangKO_026390 [Sandaracinaceae bacterium]
MKTHAWITLLLWSFAGLAHAQDFEVLRGEVGESEHFLFGRGGVVVHVVRLGDRVDACAYRVEGERLSGRTQGERCEQATPPRLVGWGSEAPRAFVGEAELTPVPPHEGLALELSNHRAAWLALVEIGQALSPRGCTFPRRYLNYGMEEPDGLHVQIACRPGVHISTEPRRVYVRAGSSYHHRTSRCRAFADARAFEEEYVDGDGGVCFRDFIIDRHLTRADIEERFHGRCRADGDRELVCEGFRIEPGQSVVRVGR